MMRKNSGRGLWAILALALALALPPVGATAAVAYRFNPVLSLTGDCSESTVDPVPDPGCPGGKHPEKPFTSPRSVATDFHGDIYVVSFGHDSANGAEGRIDVFAPDGSFLTEIPDPFGPKSVAVDSEGNMYVFEYSPGVDRIRRFKPSLYKPATGEIFYAEPPTVIIEIGAFASNLAIDVENDHLFVSLGPKIDEFKAAVEGNELVEPPIGKGLLQGQGTGLAVDVAHKRIYASDLIPPEKYVVRVFELESPHALIETIDGSSTPQGKFVAEPSLAVNEETGDLFTFTEGENPSVVNQLTSSGGFIAQIGSENGIKPVFREEIGIDNGPLSPNRGYLFVPSHPSGTGHSLAFGPTEECEPIVEALSFANVTATEAELRSKVNPCGVSTSFIFEFTTQTAFEEREFAEAEVAGQGQLPAVNSGTAIAAPATGLSPGTPYRFRIRATNTLGSAAAEGSFSTYPFETRAPCPNDPLRSGFSALLPDCRAYELVTPPDTNSRIPEGVGGAGLGTGYFPSPQASIDGGKVSFFTEGGPIPGLGGAGNLGGDSYLAVRGGEGWSTHAAGPTGVEAEHPHIGSSSPDQEHTYWSTGGSAGSAGAEGVETTYVRYPDGHSSLVGRGSVGTDGAAKVKLITENAGHTVFTSNVQLEPNAPPSGTNAVYDRTADEALHVVSLLPGPGNQTPKGGENATYLGASLDGRGLAFSIGSKLYLRRDDSTTYKVGEGLTFAGVAEGGGRVFYLQGGNLKAFDAGSGATISFTTTGDATPVNVSADGTSAYFVSPSVLPSPAEPAENPEGATPVLNEENLYLSREGAVSFVGTVTERDVKGEKKNIFFDGLGLWTEVVGPSSGGEPGRFGADPSRTTPNGSTLLFQSRADLTDYESEEHVEVYRYDASGSLTCLSCNPTQASPTGEARLETIHYEFLSPGPSNAYALVQNLRDDGRRAFFQSTEPLVASDTDGLQDVYEWEAQGVGSCDRAEGCVYLISSGQSAAADYLFAVSDGGNDVFFRSSDRLLGADTAETPSIYDAQVEGGFPEGAAPEPCEGEGCRPSLAQPPAMLAPESGAQNESSHIKRCPKSKRTLQRHGKVRCVGKRHPKHKHHRRAGAGTKGGSK